MQAGGVNYLVQQANENPMGFLSLLGRVMPRESHLELTADVRIRQEVRRDLVEKLVVLMRTPAAANDDSIEASATLPAITHAPDVMLRAAVTQDRESLSRRGENARRESMGTVAGAVSRAANVLIERATDAA